MGQNRTAQHQKSLDLWFDLCSSHFSYGINDCLRTVKLNVVAATLRHDQYALSGKSGELLLQPHQGRLPFFEVRSVIRRGNHDERGIWKRARTLDLFIALGNAFFFEEG